MNKSGVLIVCALLGLVGIFAFQNCGQMSAPQASPAGEIKQGADRVYEIPLVNVRPTEKSAATESTHVVLDGNFPDGCPAELTTSVESNGTVHRVHAIVTKTGLPNQVCTMALRVFEEKVSLGDLPPGEHTVQFETDEGLKTLTITVN